MTRVRISALAVPVCFVVAGLLPRPADAISIQLNSQPSIPLLTAQYDPDARRLVAQSELGNVQCGSGSEPIPGGTFSLRLDGRDYRMTPQSAAQVFGYAVNTRTFQGRLTLLDEMVGTPSCESSNVSTANLRLQLDNEPLQRIGQGVIYRTALPRRIEVRVIDPLICFDFGGSSGNLRLDLTDANDETWNIEGVTLAQYAHSSGVVRVGLPPTMSCFGFDDGAGNDGGLPGIQGATDSLFGSGFEIHEIYPDLAVAVVELPSALENVFRYRIEVANYAVGAAQHVRLRDFYPKTGVPRFVDGAVNWSCSASAPGANCGAVLEGGGRVDLVNASLPGYVVGSGTPPRLLIEVERTFSEYQLGQAFSIQAAATIAPPGLPDRDRANNSSNILAVVSEPAGPIAADDLFATDQDSPLVGNVYADNGFGADEHAAALPFFVARVNGAEASVGVPVELRAAPGGGNPATVTLQSNGSMSFDPGDAFVPVPAGGLDQASFTYTLRDADLLESTATVSINVTGLNDPPVAGDVTLSIPVVAGNASGAVGAPGVLGQSSDPDHGATISVSAVNGGAYTPGAPFPIPGGAVLTMNADGSFTYFKAGVAVGQSDSFDITISDGEFTDVARVTINFVAL